MKAKKSKKKSPARSTKTKRIRYAAVGLGYISQSALLPSFKRARENSELTALVSSDPEKLKQLGKKYGVKNLYSYEQFDECLESGEIDAIYIATPNTLHAQFAIAALERGIHVLCEKPMAADEPSCRMMCEAAEKSGAKLMIAYRLHFEAANLDAMEIAASGKIGDLKLFHSVFSVPVKDPENIRLRKDLGGGPLYDIGIYCINAARYLFRSEPIEVFAMSASSDDAKFEDVDEMTCVTLRFPQDRLANFCTSFSAHHASAYELIGTKGKLRLEGAYDYAAPMKLITTIGEKTKTKNYPKRDQFGPELIYLSDCILKDRQPEPSGREGLADVRIIRKLLLSSSTKSPLPIEPVTQLVRPSPKQKITRRGVEEPQMIHANSPSG